MSRRKQIRSKQQFSAALELERADQSMEAIKLFQKSVTTDPANAHSWNRLMILYRKNRTKEEEIKLLKTAIGSYKASKDAQHKTWLQENGEKADSSRELAGVLGLLEEDGAPSSEDAHLQRWKTRLYLLEYRLKNARKKKTTKKKTPATAKKRVKTAKTTQAVKTSEPKKQKAKP